MSNKTISAQFYERFAKNHDVEGCDPLFAETAVIHSNNVPMPLDFNGYKQVGYMFLAGFSDLDADILSQIEEGDQVVTHVQWRGTQTHEFNGIPATGRSFCSNGVTIDRIANGQIVERQEIGDILGMMRQLGLIAD